MTTEVPVKLRSATVADLPAVNAIIDAAVMTWELPERVKRLALPVYRYNTQDLDFLELIVALDSDGHSRGVAGLEPADAAEAPASSQPLLLHGIYVLPDWQRCGIGRRLLQASAAAARRRGFDSLLVKAQAGAEAFFRHQGFASLPATNPERDYPHRFWKPV